MDAPWFDSETKQSAKQFFQIYRVHTCEPARGLMEKKKADCVVSMDVLEHIFIEDIQKVVSELFFLAKKNARCKCSILEGCRFTYKWRKC